MFTSTPQQGMARRNARSDPPPNGDGVLDHSIQVFFNLPDPSKAKFLISISGFGLPNPLPNPLPEAAHSAGPTQHLQLFASWRLLDRKNRVPRGLPKRSNFDAVSTSIFERLGSVLEAQDGSQIDQKSMKIEFPSLSVSASFFTSIFDQFLLPTSTHWISRK